LHKQTLRTLVFAAATVAASAAQAAESPAYPDKPIRLVIGSAAGSGPDIISRVLAERLYKTWGQRVVVDARPGVAGILSADLVLRAAADGYTWMMLTSQLMVATSVYPNIKFDLDKDFTSVCLIGTVPFMQLVNPSLPVKSIRDLIDLAKKQPGTLRYGSAGAGASEHLSGFLFTRLTGTNMLHVPYKGIAQALADTIANEVQLTYPVLPAGLPHVQSGRLRALGVTTPKRTPLLPDVPAIDEVVPGYQMMGWYSIVVPRGTPEPIIAKITKEIARAVKEPDFGEQLKGLGLEMSGVTGRDFDAFRRDQRKRITEIVKASGVDLK